MIDLKNTVLLFRGRQQKRRNKQWNTTLHLRTVNGDEGEDIDGDNGRYTRPKPENEREARQGYLALDEEAC